ncbi:putative conserved hypothetical protein 95 [Lyophyllum shimeji]|uniref:Trimethylguanosine synthase n=1 Tax=Lyophyllum shimeji TaxID=47721 RepID=A0A9P3UNB6_LYOSH|nr:putative conserved hypothetical protein 95 [Lyophyllum shimeji]
MGKRRGGLSGLGRFVREAFTAETPAAATEKLEAPQELQEEEHRPAKRQKTGAGTEAKGGGDVSGHARASKEVLFAAKSLFLIVFCPPGCLLDEEGWYSVTPELVANQIAERCRCDLVLDAFCGVGGNAIAFAKTCQRVIALDTSSTRLALARHNAQIYGVADRIEFVLADYISFAETYLALPQTSSNRRIDVVFLSPPWGGPAYVNGTPPFSPPLKPGASEDVAPNGEHPSYSLASIKPVHGAELFRLSRRITRNIAYYLPRNTRLDEISDLLESESAKAQGDQEKMTNGDVEHVEVEEEWMGSKLKALTCYFGGLVTGQEALF